MKKTKLKQTVLAPLNFDVRITSSFKGVLWLLKQQLVYFSQIICLSMLGFYTVQPITSSENRHQFFATIKTFMVAQNLNKQMAKSLVTPQMPKLWRNNRWYKCVPLFLQWTFVFFLLEECGQPRGACTLQPPWAGLSCRGIPGRIQPLKSWECLPGFPCL